MKKLIATIVVAFPFIAFISGALRGDAETQIFCRHMLIFLGTPALVWVWILAADYLFIDNDEE